MPVMHRTYRVPGAPTINPDTCTQCGVFVQICPTGTLVSDEACVRMCTDSFLGIATECWRFLAFCAQLSVGSAVFGVLRIRAGVPVPPAAVRSQRPSHEPGAWRRPVAFIR